MTIHHGDALDILRTMPDESVGTIVTSPPYGLRNRSPRQGQTNQRWGNAALMNGDYADGGDDVPTPEYIAYHTQVAHEMMRVLRTDGCLFYNHRERVQAGHIEDHAAIILDRWLRQRIVWARSGGLNHDPHFFVPAHEYIYLCPREDWRRAQGGEHTGEMATTVWRIHQARSEHPAAFPEELVRRCLVMGGRRGPVLDPFMGSGTTAVVAQRLGMEWIGIEKSAAYVSMAQERLRALQGALL